ncbi:Laccase-14 [Morella rubra]|uniref:Laccase-14 n=1 Tax=Morella rubra TaxID=262757 RepID=A0A6A1VBS8_9ROSI|nr:Laccase-14 [Morella rubra]
MFFGIAQNNLTVVAQDGAYIKPITTNYIMVTPGQTMDALLTANQTPSEYYVAATPFFDSSINVPYNITNMSAILNYTGTFTSPSSPLYPTLPNVTDMDAANAFTSQIRALASADHSVNIPQDFDRRIFITVSVNLLPCEQDSCAGPNGKRLAASLNNISFVTSSIDILQAYYRSLFGTFEDDFPSFPTFVFNYTSGVSEDEYLLPSRGTKALMIDYSKRVETVFQGTNIGNAENHPMHLHGFSFYLVGTGSGNFENTTSPDGYNLQDPPAVNTIGVPKNGWSAIRFVANNPEVWFMHCHLERHASWGMATVLIVRNGMTEETSLLPPPANLPTCS